MPTFQRTTARRLLTRFQQVHHLGHQDSVGLHHRQALLREEDDHNRPISHERQYLRNPNWMGEKSGTKTGVVGWFGFTYQKLSICSIESAKTRTNESRCQRHQSPLLSHSYLIDREF